jgi:hypothetical protein
MTDLCPVLQEAELVVEAKREVYHLRSKFKYCLTFRIAVVIIFFNLQLTEFRP